MSSEVQRIPKPNLRNFLHRSSVIHIPLSILVGIAAGLAYKVLVKDPRKKAYADFYKTYDAEADFERMRQAGIFQSCRPDGEEEE